MDNFISEYLLKFDEINVLTRTSYDVSNGDKQKISDDMLSFLINAYTTGISTASKMLGSNLAVDIDRMSEVIFLLIDGKTFEDRVSEHVAAKDLNALKTLAESEFHRVYNTAIEDGGKEFEKYSKNEVIKTWYTVGDEKVRDTHRYLESQTVKLDEEFFTYDGDHALYPGGFLKAENNVNCRCTIILTKT